MNMIEPFLNCDIWSIPTTRQPYKDFNFYLVSTVYHYNSLTSGIVNFSIDDIQLPEFEISNIDLLGQLDFDFINKHAIPILRQVDNNWKIDLTFYEDYKLQSVDIQSNQSTV